MRVLGGLHRALPITGSLAVIATAAMAGVPLLNGFLSKEMFFAETALVGGDEEWWMSIAAVTASMFSVTYSLRFISVFFGKLPAGLPKEPHEPPHWMRFPIELLVLLCLIVGTAPSLSVGPFLHDAVFAVLGKQTPPYSLAIWHGFNLPLLLSIFALTGGIVLFAILRRTYGVAGRERAPLLHRLSGAQIFESSLLRLFLAASRLLGAIGTKRLQAQLLWLILAFICAPLVIAGFLPGWLPSPTSSPADPLFALVWLIGCGCAIAAAWQAKYHRLAALILVGGTGLVTSLTFLWLSAPDLALTQLMVETVTTVLLLLGLRWLPPRVTPRELSLNVPRRVWIRRSRDLLIAAAGGIGMAALSYAALVLPVPPSLGDFFIVRALPEGGGSNVVNVLLVDFRGFDTLGEITVLAIVGLTVYALLRRFRPAPESVAIPAQQTNDVDPAVRQRPSEQAESGHRTLPRVYLRLLLPFMGIIAAYFFLRGHNLPGGGFVAALIFSVAIICQYMLAGTAWIESHLRVRPHRWLSYGLLIACGTGLGAWCFGYPFLTSHTLHLSLPLIGEIHVPSALAFDVGVFVVVVGSTMLILVALAHQSVRSHRVPTPASPNPSEMPTREII
jgi:multicomponent K+:H+ antiporter subunit A